ncbi:MAG: phage BR0599 family protein, partial [Pseudomonadota bacterium]
DRQDGDRRVIELWQPLRADLGTAPQIRHLAGFDGQAETARLKFANLNNFQGFPDIPGDDWSFTDPSRAGRLDGGSRRQ